jgi:lysophospholipid acyltransferase (LPLAT)-like uncharacterized protein
MKLRQPWLIKTVGLVVAQIGRSWLGSLDFHYRALGPDVRPQVAGRGQRYIYAFWHETGALPIFQFATTRCHVMISEHADGQMIAEVCRNMRIPVLRGSATRGGVKMVRQILRDSRLRHMAITPDGPRGPRRHLKGGIIYLAARTGIPVVPCGVGFDRPWRLRSWDRFALPRPWSRATCVSGVPVVVPRDAGKEQLEDYRRRVQQDFDWVSALAEQWAETGRWPATPPHNSPLLAEVKAG